MKLKPPCKACEDRRVGCHGQCIRYQNYKEERQKLLDAINEEKDLNDAFMQARFGRMKDKR